MTTHVLQIVPTPPHLGHMGPSGIGDYALLLAEQMQKDYGVTTHFLFFCLKDLADVKFDSAVNGFPVTGLSAHSCEAFASALPKGIDAIILHLCQYPYFNTNLRGTFGFGTPFWLPKALETAINLYQLKLIVMFDELPKLYWRQTYVFNLLNPIHAIVSRQIAEIASGILTDNYRNKEILLNWTKKPVAIAPVFSTIGEIDRIPLLSGRRSRMVIFGGSRSRIYNSQNAVDRLTRACNALGIKEIYDIGLSLDLKNKYNFENITFIEKGYLSPEDTQGLLLTSIAGCLDYTPFPGELAKSSVFAAYCAHGIVPISTQYNPSEGDGIYMNQHYLNLDDLKPLSLSELQAISDNVQSWYQPRSLKSVAKMFVSQIIEEV
jgi:hypothetical protein